MKECKISIYSFVIPLLAGLAAFSSKDDFPDYQLTQFISWSLLIVFGVIFVKNFKYRNLAVLLISAVVLFRILNLLEPNFLYSQYLSVFFYAVIVIFSGTCIVLKKPVLLLKQMYWISIISIIMCSLQINGVLWTQKISSALDWKVASDSLFLFQKYSSDLWGGLSQTRPDGFTHANNLTSQLLLFFYAYGFFYYAFNTNLIRPPRMWLFAIAFACALTGGKVIILGIVMVNATAWIFLRKKNGRLLFHTLVITIAAYLLYFILYPGLFVLNLNYDSFVFNIMGRIFNLSHLTGIPIFQTIYEFFSGFYTGEYVGVANPDQYIQKTATTGAYSGIAYMLGYFPVIISGIIIVILLLARNLRRLDNLYIHNMRDFLLVMFIALICSVFGGPFVSTVWFFFFLSFVMVPLTLPYLSQRFQKFVSSEFR